MSTPARHLSPPALLAPRSSRALPLTFALVAAFVAILALTAAPARALVTTVGATTVGLQPRNESYVIDGAFPEEPEIEKRFPAPKTFANANGHPVMHSTENFAIYWDPTYSYHGDWQKLIDGFLQALGNESGTLGNVFSVDAQYTDTTNVPAKYHSVLRATYHDTAPYPIPAGCTDPNPLVEGDAITCLTDAQVQEQLQAFIAQNKLPKGMGVIYTVLTPPGVTICLDAAATHCSDHSGGSSSESYKHSFCSYHSAINPGNVETGSASTVLYATIPWTAGGVGDGHLKAANQTQAPECQDGGFNPASKPVIEEREKAHEVSPKEKEEEAKMSEEEKLARARARSREGPHQQEPNQASGRSPDGFFDTGLADPIINQVAVEQQNVVTDPLLNAWQDEHRFEATDECRNFFAAGTVGGSVTAVEGSEAGTLSNQTLGGRGYYLNTAFNFAGVRLHYPGVACLGGVTLEPSFTLPNPVNNGEPVAFNGMESDISLNSGVNFAGGVAQPTWATYTWNFGDGTPTVTGYAPGSPECTAPWLSPCAGSEFHSYQYGGTYNVTLTVTDVGGYVASVSHQLSVNGPLKEPVSVPSKETTSGSTSGTSGSSGSGGAGTTSTTPPRPPAPAQPAGVPAPLATTALVTRTLKAALRKGILVSYSVNEQVAGRFEVLLSRVLAKRLGVTGSPALGLPAGTPPQLVIAKAILVTTKGGRSTVDIQFSKRTAARLAPVHKLALMLRLIVRNASSASPASTTVLSSITLH